MRLIILYSSDQTTAEVSKNLQKLRLQEIVLRFSRYTSSDYYPFETITYYRLKQVDNDGKFSYSKIISLLGSGLKICNC